MRLKKFQPRRREHARREGAGTRAEIIRAYATIYVVAAPLSREELWLLRRRASTVAKRRGLEFGMKRKKIRKKRNSNVNLVHPSCICRERTYVASRRIQKVPNIIFTGRAARIYTRTRAFVRYLASTSPLYAVVSSLSLSASIPLIADLRQINLAAWRMCRATYIRAIRPARRCASAEITCIDRPTLRATIFAAI